MLNDMLSKPNLYINSNFMNLNLDMMLQKKYLIIFFVLMLFGLDTLPQCVKETSIMYPDDFRSLRTRHTYRAGNDCAFFVSTDEDYFNMLKSYDNPDTVISRIKKKSLISYKDIWRYQSTFDTTYLQDILNIFDTISSKTVRQACLSILGFYHFEGKNVKKNVDWYCPNEWMLFTSYYPDLVCVDSAIYRINGLVTSNGNDIYLPYFEQINTILLYYNTSKSKELLFRHAIKSNNNIIKLDAIVCMKSIDDSIYTERLISSIINGNELSRYEINKIAIIFIKYNLSNIFNKMVFLESTAKSNKESINVEIKKIKNECNL